MIRLSIQSSNISSIGYDTVTATLEVEFTSHDVYQYFSVPAHLYEALIHAQSHGQFLNDNIRYHYRYQKVS